MKNALRVIGLLALSAHALAGGYVGDYAPGDTVDCNFTTFRPSTGATFTLAGTPAISAYKDNSTTQTTTGITLTADFDSVTGLNHVRVTTGSDGTHFSAGSFQELVITTGTVDSVSVTGTTVCSFSLNKVSALRPTTAARTLLVDASGNGNANLVNIAGSAVSTSTAQLGVNVVNFGGSAGTFSSGRPEVNTTHWGGTAVASARPLVDSVSISGDSTAADTLETWLDGTAGSAAPLGILDQGTAQAATATTIQLRSAAAFGDDTVLGATIMACGSTQTYCQSAIITDYVGSTDTATVATWPVTPSGTVTYYLFGTAPSSGGGGSLTAADVWAYGTRSLTILDEDSTTIDLNASYVGGVTVFDEDLTTMDINATTIGTVTTLTNAPSDSSGVTTLLTRVGSPTNLGSGASLSANAVDIESQTDDIGVAGAGLTAADDATLAAISTVSGYVDTEVAAILDDTGTSGVVVASGSKTGYALSSTGLNAITLTEPSGKPSWNSTSITDFLAWLIAPTRNKVTQTSTTKTIRNDADNANIVQCSVSDDGTTFTLSECSP